MEQGIEECFQLFHDLMKILRGILDSRTLKKSRLLFLFCGIGPEFRREPNGIFIDWAMAVPESPFNRQTQHFEINLWLTGQHPEIEIILHTGIQHPQMYERLELFRDGRFAAVSRKNRGREGLSGR